jgi:hypothetical protein
MASYNFNNTGSTILRDQQHADHLFNVDQFRLAPKHQFLFHVAFGINRAALQNAQLVQAYGEEIGMLVKSIDLPSYTVETQTLNQYNRRKVTQYRHKGGEIGIKFHDDNMGLINQLWQSYYSYYYADPLSATAPGAYSRNATKSYSLAMPVPYGLDNGSTTPFLNYIKIYQMARHEYVMYQVWNPIVKSFNHNRVDYAGPGVHDVDMKIEYEAISYETGAVEDGNPEGFAQSHYDHHPSPLGGGTSGNSPSLAGISIGNLLGPGILGNALNTVNNYQSANGLVVGAAVGAAAAPLIGAAIKGVASLIGSAVSGLSGFSFPGANKTDSSNTEAGTTGTDSANEGDDPSSEEEDTTQSTEDANQQAVEDANTQDQIAAAQSENNAGGFDEAGPWNQDAGTGTDNNPSSNFDSGSTDDYSFDF